MTRKRDLKKRVRERQARTGEAYTTALAHVTAARADDADDADGASPAEPAEAPRSPVPVLEMVDLSPEAAQLGLTCGVAMNPELAALVDGAAVLARLRAALLATSDDRSTELLRAVILRGERPATGPGTLESLASGKRFLARARAGIGGVSESGHMLAMHVDGRAGAVMIVCVLWLVPAQVRKQMPAVMHHEPSLIIASLDGLVEPLDGVAPTHPVMWAMLR